MNSRPLRLALHAAEELVALIAILASIAVFGAVFAVLFGGLNP